MTGSPSRLRLTFIKKKVVVYDDQTHKKKHYYNTDLTNQQIKSEINKNAISTIFDKQNSAQNSIRNRSRVKIEEIEGVVDEELLKHETTGRQPKFKLKHSSQSPYLKDISSFIFGGHSSRFLALRKHINSLESHKLNQIPFYSWQCLTINGTINQQINVIIKEQAIMDMLLKVLIWTTNSIDGIRGTAEGLKRRLTEDQAKKGKVDDEAKMMIDHQVMLKALFALKMLRMRHKISFKCMKQGKTLSELVLGQVLKSYKALHPDKEQMIDEMVELVNTNDFDSFHSMLKVINRLRSIQDEVACNYSFSHVNMSKEARNRSVRTPEAKNQLEQEQMVRRIVQQNRQAHNSVFSIFQDTKLDNEYIYNLKSIKLSLIYKKKKSKLGSQISMINYILKIGTKGFNFIFCKLKLIKKVKQLFALEIVQGRETVIPQMLRIGILPVSFQYYDPIITILNNQIDDDNVKYQFNIQKQINSTNLIQQSLVLSIKMTFGQSADKVI